MLFNSFGFLFVFLPLVLAGYFGLGRREPAWAAAWLALASLFFYGYWNVRYLPLLLLSVVFNYVCGRLLADPADPARDRRRLWLVLALAANLGLLACYKYANFFVDVVNNAADLGWTGWQIVLPIGISFFTFTQIAFLVDCYRGQVKEFRFIHYLLFVTYFPHLIAGPVLHHKEMMPQFASAENYRPRAANFAIGLSIFVVGLAKKVLIADNISPMVGPVFASGAEPQLLEAWIGALAYSCQLYFDFSGYCDMAIGLSRLFGVKLPLNFNSPYKASDISDFWRRWHMTLSRFLRDYLYVALGGNRNGPAARYRNLMLTMLLGGLWHGAGWTFIAWGGLHGLFLVLHHGWAHATREQAWRDTVWWRRLATGLTFLAVTLAWVLFRAPDLASGLDIIGAMGGGNGISLPAPLAPQAGWLAALGIHPQFEGIRWIKVNGVEMVALVTALLLVWLAPNTQQIFRRFEPCLERVHAPGRQALAWPLSWSPSTPWCLACTGLFMACLFGMNRVSEFLYFQF